MTQQEEIDLIDIEEEPAAKSNGSSSGQFTQPAPATVSRSRHLSGWFILLILAAAVAAGVRWWLESQGYETTDDAQIEGHLDSVSARVNGTVTYINPRVENNQLVEAGTLLMKLDPRDYEADLEHAKANVDTRKADASSAQAAVPIVSASAFSQLRAAEAARDQAVAGVDSEQAELVVAEHRLRQDEALYARAERDRVRYQALVEKREISRSDYDARETEATAAAQAVEADRAALTAREQRIVEARGLITERQAQIEGARTAPQQVTNVRAKSESAAGELSEARADLHTAQLNLSYTKITSVRLEVE